MPNHVTITGRLGDDIDLRFTPNGKAVANGRIADTPRRLNPQTQQWEDAGETLWLGFTIWEAKAEALAEAAHKGDLVTVTGELVARSWDKDGEKRTVTEIKAREVAVVPRRAAGPQSHAPQSAQGGNPWGGQPQQPDPWAGQQAGTGGGWGGQQAERAPF